MTRRVAFGRTAIALQAVTAVVVLALLVRPSLPFGGDERWTIHVALADAGGLSAGARGPGAGGGGGAGPGAPGGGHGGPAGAARGVGETAPGGVPPRRPAAAPP